MYQIVSFCLLFLSQLLINNLRSLSILQVASAFVYRLQNGGDFPRYVESLGQCLLYYLKLKKADIHIMLVRRHCQEVIWHLWWAYFLLIGEKKKENQLYLHFMLFPFLWHCWLNSFAINHSVMLQAICLSHLLVRYILCPTFNWWHYFSWHGPVW